MSILYYDPFTEFDRLFDDAFAARFLPSTTIETTEGGRAGRGTQRRGPWRPRLDLHENKEANTVSAVFELPGVKSEDVNIDVHQNRLTVSGEFKSDIPPDDPGYVVRERPRDKFSRTINLPAGVKPEDIKAKLENGLLIVTFPKVTPEQEPRRVAISS
ncbi:small heat shock protein [Pisolithus croceorrhizus]|nr:small heat shock protein [Pisolithus croceorrhizus]KAI6159718.1 small heat shock protein [Pisolithus thermaeus]